MKRSSTVLVLLALLAASAAAVMPGTWSQKTEADYSEGKFDKTVVTSLGEVMLARATETLLEPAEDPGVVSAIAVDARGRVVVATAPDAKLHRLSKGKLTELAKLPGVLVRALQYVDGKLVAGTCGDEAGVYTVGDDGKVTPIWTDKEVTFVWAIVPAKGGDLYVATGPRGRVYRVTAKGKATVIHDSEDKNVLALAAGEDGALYAGTGENGLVVKIDPARKAGRILYDAGEAEISRIVVAPGGAVYAATSDSTKASADGEAPSGKEKGKPAPADKPKAGEAARPAKGPSATRPAKVLAELERIEKQLKDLKPPKPLAGKAAPKDTGPTARPSRPGRTSRKAGSGPTPSKGDAKGNAVYRIDAEGFVRAVFRRPVNILDMVVRGEELVLATGRGGQVFAVDLANDRTSMLVKLDPKDVTALAADGKGRLLAGTADKAAVYALADGLAGKGTFLSKALDAKQIAAWGTMQVAADVPAGCKVTLATRSGNVAEPDDKTWSSWSREVAADRGWGQMASPAGRFLQYRLTLTGRGADSPTVDQVQLVYQVKNLAPVVTGVQVQPGVNPDRRERGGSGNAGSPRMTHRLVKIAAADPNGDALQFAVYFRAAGRQKWIRLVEKFDKPLYPWDITTVPDGVYEVRVEATDAPANPQRNALSAGRISRAVVVDNAPPAVAALKAKADAKGNVTITGRATDAGGRIVKIACAVDSITEWHDALPDDGICDSPKEGFSAVIEELTAGVHHIAVKVLDEFGNAGYASVEVTVGR